MNNVILLNKLFACTVEVADQAAAEIQRLQQENERLRAEINRVAPFLAIHGVEGYTMTMPDVEPPSYAGAYDTATGQRLGDDYAPEKS